MHSKGGESMRYTEIINGKGKAVKVKNPGKSQDQPRESWVGLRPCVYNSTDKRRKDANGRCAKHKGRRFDY